MGLVIVRIVSLMLNTPEVRDYILSKIAEN